MHMLIAIAGVCNGLTKGLDGYPHQYSYVFPLPITQWPQTF